MLPKRSRLSAKEMREVLRIGTPLQRGTVSARYTKTQGSKAAVVVSTKVAGSAVERNRLRRAAYAALDPLPKDTYLVVFIQKKAFNPEEILSLCSTLS